MAFLKDLFAPKQKVVARASGLSAIRALAKNPVQEEAPEEIIPVSVPKLEEQPVPPMYDSTKAFLREVEGFETEGYVPKDKETGKPLGTSGVTVASGFDLGAHSVSDLKKLNLPDELYRKLKPYTGKKKLAAQEYLQANPLQLTPTEAELVNHQVKQSKYEATVRAFESSSDIAWQELPESWRTAITSVAFQYGNLATETPNFWRQVTEGDFPAAYRNLRKFGDDYKTRRNKEADLVEGDVNWKPAGAQQAAPADNSGTIIIEDED